MSFEAFPAYAPVDVELVDKIVCKLKSQGIFDQFRKDCLADVDTKPAYQNLQQRVNGTVATFLATQTWQQGLNKTQMRESLRRHVQQGFLEVGVDRIVDQVVNPKVFTVFMPKVEDVVYGCLGIEKPKHPPPSNNTLSGRKLTLLDLLPKDLDPVSPESDNLSFDDDDETKDETNNNESLSKLDDSQVSGISDLSSHMGDSFKEQQENNLDSNTVKSATSAKDNSAELHFENFENLSEKIKQAEITHVPVTSSQSEEQDEIDSKTPLYDEHTIMKVNREEISMEIDSVSNSTFEDTKIFVNNKIIKDDTCSRTMSEDSMSSSSFSSKLKKEKAKLSLADHCTNSIDKSDIGTPCKDSSSDKEVKVPPLIEDIKSKTEQKPVEHKEQKKVDDVKDKKHRDSSSSSSKTSKSSSDKHRSSESKHRSNYDKKDDSKQNKEKTKDDKDKERLSRDEKDKSSRSKEERHHSSKEKHRDKSHDKDNEKRKDKTDSKEITDKYRKNEKEQEKDKNTKDKGKRYDKDKERPEKEKDKHDKDKDRHDREKEKHDKDKHEKSKRDKEKLEKEKKDKDKYESRDKDRDKDKEKDRSREKERGKSEKENRSEKDKDSNRNNEDKYRDEKKKDSSKYHKPSSSSSSKRDDSYKNDTKDKSKRSDEQFKEKTSNEKVGKNDEERKERKRKVERCNDEIKLKEARRSWDRDSSGGNSKGHSSHHKTNSGEYRVSASSGSTKEKRTGQSSNQQKKNERKLEPVNEEEEPSDVDMILMKINSSIEESQNIMLMDEHSVKKPKIAKNIFEIKKIMQARKNLARLMRNDKKKKENIESVDEADVTNSASTAQPTQEKTKIREENKENIKSGQIDKMKSPPKICHAKGKFTGFLENDIEKAKNALQSFRASSYSYCRNIGLDVAPTEVIENTDYSKVCDFNEELLDDNLNKLKPKAVSLERRKTYPDEKQVSKAVENIMSGKNGCYVLLQDCTDVVQALNNASQQQTNNREDNPKQMAIISPVAKEQGQATVSVNNPANGQDDPKKARSLPAILKVYDCIVKLDSEVISNASQELLKQQEAVSKKATSSTASKPVAKPAKQEQQDSEPSSPGRAVSVALNPYLNDSILSDAAAIPSVSLTEAMLDNLMKESTMINDEECCEDSEDSDCEYISKARDNLRKLEVNHELYNEKELIRHIAPPSDKLFSSYESELAIAVSNNEGLVEPDLKRIKIDKTSSNCDMTPVKGSPPDGYEDKTMKRRNQRLCRSSSQRYDSTDLYKPRPVLPQNAKRVRTPRSVSSEDLSVRERCDSNSPAKKRAR